MTQVRSPATDVGAHAAASEIGPNAVIQLIHALEAAGLQPAAKEIFSEAAASDWLAEPPSAMVDERPVAAIHQAVRRVLPQPQAAAILADAGLRTGDYILAHRIPKLAQAVLKIMPASIAARMLTKAITAHAWTFAGSGRFTASVGKTVTFEIAANPLCAGEHADHHVCVWHASVFQRLFQVLVSPYTRVTETACGAKGNECCRFVADWTSIPDAANIYASRRSKPIAGQSETLSAR
ncbi:bacteriochlorophyll 4-vinyl reductase [Rhodopseudomonas palustris]|uniref:bacteriochlorophyll 4-vinyl reductase n=1 Tax=Rhodopseudomonas palustris TaxID=1076 RepID=UPI00115DE05A|nr:bacteriochlorophyll 4-vinyl reductase [Rhodopseudomonas palustris]QDL96562.1 bacteriochlorophyll 4-vinyl reductase [Rhodopseudomonas palustris]